MADERLDGFCKPEDASSLISMLRLVRSETELNYVRRARTRRTLCRIFAERIPTAISDLQ
jgi:hypothetical protein